MSSGAPGLSISASGHARVALRVNGTEHLVEVEPGLQLVDLLRERLGLKGTHLGCGTGDCGACTVQMDGMIVKSCLVLAAAAAGSEITTVEGLGDADHLHPVQRAFWDQHGFQCGFCLPGMLFSAIDLLAREPDPDEVAVRQALSGNLCRCTGYQDQVAAVLEAGRSMRGGER